MCVCVCVDGWDVLIGVSPDGMGGLVRSPKAMPGGSRDGTAAAITAGGM